MSFKRVIASSTAEQQQHKQEYLSPYYPFLLSVYVNKNTYSNNQNFSISNNKIFKSKTQLHER